MENFMKASFKTTKCKALDSISGQMDRFTMEIGSSPKCMEKAPIHFPMEPNSKDSIIWERDMEKA